MSLIKYVEKQIQQIYNKVFNEVFNKAVVADLSEYNRETAIKRATTLAESKKYQEFAKKFAIELAKKGLSRNRGVWRKYYAAAKKAHYIALPASYKKYEYEVLSKVVEENFKMIKSIPMNTLETLNHKYTSSLIEEVAKGTKTRGSFQRELASHGAKHAKLIARTETAKMQTAITEMRSTELGSTAYRWLSSNDKRTRKSHREMNGVIVFWQDNLHKPLLDNMRGNAGEFPNCRCDAQPIFDESDLPLNFYKVYDYNTDTVIRMNKKSLLEALKVGKL